MLWTRIIVVLIVVLGAVGEVAGNLLTSDFGLPTIVAWVAVTLSLVVVSLFAAGLGPTRISAFGRPHSDAKNSGPSQVAATNWRDRTDPDRPVRFRPGVLRPSVVFGLAAAIWLTCTLRTWASAGWDLLLSADEMPSNLYYLKESSGDFVLVLACVAMAAAYVFAGGWKLGGLRLERVAARPYVRVQNGEDSVTGEGFWIFIFFLALFPAAGCFMIMLSSVYGVLWYSSHEFVLAVGFGLVLVGLPVLLASAARLGFVCAYSQGSAHLREQRYFPTDPVSVLIGRQLGKRIRDEARYLLDVLLAIPSTRVFVFQQCVVVAAGNRVAVIAFVSLPPGRYARLGSAGVLRDGQPFLVQDSAVGQVSVQLQALRSELPSRVSLRAFIVAVAADPDGGPIEFDKDLGRVLFVRHEEAAKVIGEFLAAQRYRIDTAVALRLRHLTQLWANRSWAG